MKNMKKYMFGIIALCFLLILQIVGRMGEGATVVKINGQEYNIQEAENALISMLKSDDRDKEIKAVDFLLRTSEPQFRSKKIIDAMIDLYEKLPPFSTTSKYGEDKNVDAIENMKISLFTMLTGSKDPRGKTILEETIKSENEAMKKLGLFMKEKLLEREKELESQKKGGEKGKPIVIHPAIADLSTAKVEDLEAILLDILKNSSFETKLGTVNQLRKQARYLRSKKGQTKRAIVLELLQDHYKVEKNIALQEEIIGALFNIGEEDIRAFFEEVLKDKKTSPKIRKNIELAIQMLNADRAIQKK